MTEREGLSCGHEVRVSQRKRNKPTKMASNSSTQGSGSRLVPEMRRATQPARLRQGYRRGLAVALRAEAEARRRSGAREGVLGSPRGEAPRITQDGVSERCYGRSPRHCRQRDGDRLRTSAHTSAVAVPRRGSESGVHQESRAGPGRCPKGARWRQARRAQSH